MHEDVKDEGSELATDLCIIGAGPAGITLAHQLAGSALRICLLESGGAQVERRVQKQSRGESDGYPIHLLHRSRVRAFGGTLRHPRVLNGGWAARPLDPIDFESRPSLSNPGWPFDHHHLAPYYARAQDACGIPEYEDTSTRSSRESAQKILPTDGGLVEPAIFPFSSYTFADAYDALTASSNVHVFLHCRVTETSCDLSGRRVDRVVATRNDRTTLVIRPKLVVFAAGGIENPRLLLAANHGSGIGNEHDVVGRYFAERISFRVGYLGLSDPNSTASARNGLSGSIRVTDNIQRDQGLLNCSFGFDSRSAAVTTSAVRSLSLLHRASTRRPVVGDLGRHVRQALTGPKDLAEYALSRVATRARVLDLRVQCGQSPNRSSRVSLGARKDELGTPVARVTWRMSETDHRSIKKSMDIVDAALRDRGFAFIEGNFCDDAAALVEGNHHHLGATRMHIDPQQGVVDANCRIHSMANAYVAGCSVFPTYGLSNPTLTIVAMSIRLADHIRAQLGKADEAAGSV